jgi:hypothetical protein
MSASIRVSAYMSATFRMTASALPRKRQCVSLSFALWAQMMLLSVQGTDVQTIAKVGEDRGRDVIRNFQQRGEFRHPGRASAKPGEN